MLSFECIKNEKSVYFLLTSAYRIIKYLNPRLSVTNWTFYPIFFKHNISPFAQKNAGQFST